MRPNRAVWGCVLGLVAGVGMSLLLTLLLGDLWRGHGPAAVAAPLVVGTVGAWTSWLVADNYWRRGPRR